MPPPSPVYPNLKAEDQPALVQWGPDEYSDLPFLATPADLTEPDPATVTGEEQARFEVLTGKRVQKDEEVVESARSKQVEREEQEAEYRRQVRTQQEEKLTEQRKAMSEKLQTLKPSGRDQTPAERLRAEQAKTEQARNRTPEQREGKVPERS